MAIRISATVAIICLVVTTMLWVQEQRVAVGGFRSNSERSRLVAVRFAGLLEDELIKQAGLKVVERKESDQIFQEQRIQQTGITDVATAVELGRNLNVDRIIFGAVEEAAGIIHINLKAAKVENSELLFSRSAEAEAENQTAINKAGYGLIEDLLTALMGRPVTISRPAGPQRLVIVLGDGAIPDGIKIPWR